MTAENAVRSILERGRGVLFDDAAIRVLCALDDADIADGSLCCFEDVVAMPHESAVASVSEFPLINPLAPDRQPSADASPRTALVTHRLPACDVDLLRDALVLLLWRWSGEEIVALETATMKAVPASPGCLRAERGALRVSMSDDVDRAALRRAVEAGVVAAPSDDTDAQDRFRFVVQPDPAMRLLPLEIVRLLRGVDAPSRLRHALILHAARDEEGWTCHWLHDGNRYARRTVEGLTQGLAILLEGLSAATGASLAELPLAPPRIEDRAPVSFREALPRPFESVSAQVRKQARSTPDAIAVRQGDGVLRYCELEVRADRLARLLRRRAGIGPGDVVVLCLDRTIDLPATVIGVLATGAAYVPVDPSHPPARIARVVADAGARFVVTTSRYRAALLPSDLVAVCVDDADVLAAIENGGEDDESPLPTPSPTDVAYVLYTSGSTGEPKGVCIEHGAFAHFMQEMRRAMADIGPRRWLAVITLTFDMSLVDLFLPLCRGDCVRIAAAEDVADGDALRELLDTTQVDAMQATPTTWRMLIAAGWNGHPRMLAITGGEPLTRTLADAMFARCSALWNGYGPTEATVYSLFREVDRNEEPLRRLAIGGSVPGVAHYVLDGRLRPMPDGATGELYIGGPGLARGYHGKPELTARQFIAHPFDPTPGARLYRTGDRVRRLPEGDLQYLGRIDAQLKLRGYRIEPGEIEYALLGESTVEDAVVDVRTIDEMQTLVAFVKPRAGVLDDIGASLRRRLRSLLPPYMVPERFVVVDVFPRTSSGKLDRKALAFDASSRATAAATEFVSDPLEAALIGIWRDLFEREEISVSDNFYELGGNSLLIAKMRKAIHDLLGFALDYRVLFEHDSVRDLAAHLRALPTSASAPSNASLPVETAAADGSLCATALQKHMWTTTQRRDAAAAYNIPIFFRVSGALDPDRLRAALGRLVLAVPALRASFFVSDEGAIRQRILDRREAPLKVIVPTRQEGADREAEVADIVRREACRSFDLEHDAPIRAVLVQTAPDAQLLLISLHHIVGDEESIELIASRLAALYAGVPGADARIVGEEEDGYREYLRRHETAREPEIEQADLEYWERALAGMPELHRLPIDRPRGPRQTFHGAIHEHDLDAVVSARIRTFCAQRRTTLYVCFHTALALLISRMSGQSDVVIGMPVSERHRGRYGRNVGCFLNVAMLRSESTAGQRFAELLHASRGRIAEALQHDRASLSDLAVRMGLAGTVDHSAFFQIMLVQQVSDYLRLRMDDASLEQFYPPQSPSKTDLILNIADLDEGIRLRWEYNSDLWLPGTIASMAKRFSELLERAIAEPDSPISTLFPMLPGDIEIQRAIDGPRIEFGPFVPAHALFERRARAQPDTIALRHGDEIVRYRELDALADELAGRLADRGVGPGTIVAIGVRRGIRMAMAMLAAMKAGATYLPLDPTHPPERLELMLRDAGASLLLGEAATSSIFAAAQVPILEIDVPVAGPVASPPHCVADPARDAYLIYTSGSTGVPKAVCIGNAALSHFLAAMSERFPSGRRRCWLAVVTLAFDMSLVDLFWPLTRGDTVVIAAEDDVNDGRRLRALLDTQGVDAMQATPSTWQSLLSAGWQGTTGLLAITGGEALTESLAKALLSRSEEVWNGYGPTEITVYSLLRQVRATDGPVDLLSIGAPLANVDHRVLDPDMRPVPPGVAGELYIGGPGLARCYLGRSDLTDERFVSRPDVGEGERLYRTGDLVSLLPSGNLRYLGRIDQQVKLRGYRIELGEIEQAMLAIPGVVRAAAGVKTWGETSILVGFVSFECPADPSAQRLAEIRQRLVDALPSYMVPQILIERAEFPLSSNGKVDRNALLRTVERQQGVVQLETETERRLAALWETILGVDSVGADGNFFALGGQSILITSLLYRIRSEFGIALQVGWVYEDPTLRGLAEKIDLMQALERSGHAYDDQTDFEEFEL